MTFSKYIIKKWYKLRESFFKKQQSEKFKTEGSGIVKIKQKQVTKICQKKLLLTGKIY